MNHSKEEHAETIAYNYLLSIGYKPDDFILCGWNPDFLTSDRKRWEVKRINKYGVSTFTYNQLHEYERKETNIIGVFNGKVLFIKPFSEIKGIIINQRAYFKKLKDAGYWDNDKRCVK